ncbi:MAG TPA: TIGR03086 family protein [Streptosporangiaceae bacterium]|nr:TIGR03086 family protein [Streptosporangiaceae bacterium]
MNSQTLLLDEALSYAARSVLDVTPALLPCATPCRGWNLDMLLRHTNDSLAALHEGIVTGHVGLVPEAPERDLAGSVARIIWEQAHQLLSARATTDRRQILDVGDLPLPAMALECAGAIEMAVHGWDISQACGQRRPIPDTLASNLLTIAPLLISETGRHPLFSPPVTATAHTSPGNRLVAFLGRNPPASLRPPDHPSPIQSRGGFATRG